VRWAFSAAAFALLAALAAPAAGGVESVHANFERSATVAEGSWDGYQVFVLEGTQVSVDIRVSGDVDFYVFTPGLLERYEDPNATSFPSIFSLELAHGFQYTTSKCCRVFVIDNAAKSPTGQSPDGPEQYTIVVTYGTPSAGAATSAPLPDWVNWAYPIGMVSLILSTTFWLMTPPRGGRHASEQLREFLR